MTTLAYNHKDRQIACDSRSTRQSTIISDQAKKFEIVDGVMFFLCGSVCDYDIFIKMYFGEKSTEIPECNSFTVDNGVIYRCGVTEEGLFWKQKLTNDDALGSGWQFALSAFDFGCNAKESVEYAKTRDSGTGGKVYLYDVGSGEFI